MCNSMVWLDGNVPQGGNDLSGELPGVVPSALQEPNTACSWMQRVVKRLANTQWEQRHKKTYGRF